ncbi:MAG TPA: DNA polymerase III subunit gamma/tau [Ktedonobacterales bacterium]|nr:DNA polymerase III subunit gamma/tau [Ktedonobacterales bacterium]
MASQSLYRKWRSQSFGDLIGQEPVVRTLLNAVRDHRLAHAYLFCGPRGTGKTSAARLLAKAVNCANPRDGEPCNACASCVEIAEGRSPDVIEIDAASNNGVDDIRDLRGNVGLLSTGGRFKVYVIDEVHMLSTQAFNALLKTLEEPPPHVIFVLATTEAHKVLPTIVSRCQRLNFQRHTRRNIAARLAQVAAGEGLQLELAAADLLARAAQGGMRDALSLLDQAITFAGSDIRLADARAMLGQADGAAVRRLVEHIAAGESAAGLYLINELTEAGADLRQLNSQLAELWRALVLARAGADVARIMDCGDEEAAELVALAGRFALADLTACARVFAANDTPARGLPVPQLGLELSYLECLAITRHDRQPEPAARPGATAPEAPRTASAPVAAAGQASRNPPPTPNRAQAPLAPQGEGRGGEGSPDAINFAALDADPAPSPAPRPVATRASAAQALEPVASVAVDELDAAEEPPITNPTQEDGGDWLRRVLEQWELIKKVCRQRRRTVAALLHSARPIIVAPGNPLEVVLQADYQFHLDKLREPASRADVEWAMEQVLERPCHVRFVLSGSPESDAAGGGQPGGGAVTPLNGNGGAARGGSVRASSLGASNTVRDSAQTYAPERPERPRPITPRTAATPPPAAAASAPASPPAPPSDEQRALREMALADPIVQEIMRTFPAELVEVRPLPPEGEPWPE